MRVVFLRRFGAFVFFLFNQKHLLLKRSEGINCQLQQSCLYLCWLLLMFVPLDAEAEAGLCPPSSPCLSWACVCSGCAVRNC